MMSAPLSSTNGPERTSFPCSSRVRRYSRWVGRTSWRRSTSSPYVRIAVKSGIVWSPVSIIVSPCEHPGAPKVPEPRNACNLPAAKARIQDVPDAVADKVEREHGDRQGRARYQHGPWRLGQEN